MRVFVHYFARVCVGRVNVLRTSSLRPCSSSTLPGLLLTRPARSVWLIIPLFMTLTHVLPPLPSPSSDHLYYGTVTSLQPLPPPRFVLLARSVVGPTRSTPAYGTTPVAPGHPPPLLCVGHTHPTRSPRRHLLRNLRHS